MVSLCYHVNMNKVREKRIPSYCLDKIKELIKKDKYYFTDKASNEAREDFDIFDHQEICAYLLSLENTDFDKSMTHYNNHKKWLDVYKFNCTEKGLIYIKFLKDDESGIVLISFHKTSM